MKTLISAQVVRDRHADGLSEIPVTIGATIVTPEARTVAAELGVRLVEAPAADAGKAGSAAPEPATRPEAAHEAAGAGQEAAELLDPAIREVIRKQIMARLPAGQTSAQELDRMIDRAVQSGPAGQARRRQPRMCGQAASSASAGDGSSSDPEPGGDRRRSQASQKGSSTMELIDHCAQWCKQNPRTVVFPDALDERALEAARTLVQEAYMTPVLLGDAGRIRDLARQQNCSLDGIRIVDPQDASQMDAYSRRLLDRMQGKAGITSAQAAQRQLLDPLWFGAMMLDAGDADAVVAGNLSSTAEVLRAALRVVGPAAGVSTVSSLFFMIEPDTHRVLGFADCGVVPQPTPEQLVDIAISTADSYHNVVEETPRIAMLSFSTAGSVKHDAVKPARDAVAQVRQRRSDLIIDGEMQFDTAFCPDVAARKAPGNALGGQAANVYVFPDLNAGNIAYKIAQRMGGYTALGPMIQGLRLPMHDLSRGCSAQDMVQVSLLAMKMGFGGNSRG